MNNNLFNTMSNDQTSKLHKYAYEGKKTKLKELIKAENPYIDMLDQDGKTALYYASSRGHKDCVKLLLENHANPNERCSNDETPVHAAASNGELKIICLLLEYGGDLRLHDNKNRTAKICAMEQENPTLRRKMLALIEEARMSSHSQAYQTPLKYPNLCNIIPKSKDELLNPCSVGFGILYKTTGEIGVPIVLPVIKEGEILHDHQGETFNNGSFMVYESMKWKEVHLVTVKRLHLKLAEGGQSDLIIEELKYFQKINHCPNIISLMGFCQREKSDAIMLMFERVQVGSLYNVLHERAITKLPKLKSICQIMLSVCDALIFLHQQNIIHCYVSSHSIMLTNFHSAKLANLEYAVEKSSDPTKQKKSKILDNHFLNCAYNWIAPELMEESFPNELSDMYSFCVVIWELFNVAIPWAHMSWEEIKHEIVVKSNELPVNFEKIPLPFSRIIKDGFSIPLRRMGFEEVRGALENLQISLHTQQTPKVKINKLYARPQQTPQSENFDNSKTRNNSFSEGIASINEVINSNDMETFNSMEEFDKFSELTGESFIHCDAYKTEIHLTKRGLLTSKTASKTPPEPNKQNKSNISETSNLKSKNLERSNSNSKTRTYPKDENTDKIDKCGDGKNKSPVNRQYLPYPPTNQINQTTEQTLPSTPNIIYKKHKAKLTHQNLPPTPPPLPLPSQTINMKTVSTPQNNSNPQITPSFLMSPSPTPSNNQSRSLRVSRSVDSPRKNNETSTPTTNKSEVFENFAKKNLIQMENGEIKKIPSLNQIEIIGNNNTSNYKNNNNNNQLETNNLILHDKFKILEYIYYSNLITKDNKRKIFAAIKQEQEIRKKANLYQQQQLQQQPQQSEQQQPTNESHDNSFRNDTNRKYDNFSENLVEPTPEDKRIRYIRNKSYSAGNDPCLKLDYSTASQEDNTVEKPMLMNKSSNVDKMTPKKNTESMSNTKQLIDELKKSIELKNSREPSFNGIPIQKSGSYNQLTDEIRNGMINTIRQNSTGDSSNSQSRVFSICPRSHSSNSVPAKKSSSFTAAANVLINKEHKSRKPLFDSKIGSSSLQNQSNEQRTDLKKVSSDVLPGFGSVKSLVQSYEENSSKERNLVNHKIEQIRRERFREFFDAVEQGKQMNNDQNFNQEQSSNNYQQQIVDNQHEQIQMQQFKMQNSNQQQQQPQKPPYHIQKELSTISERTEHSSSFNNCIIQGGMQSSNNTNNTLTTGESPAYTNANSNSKATTITKSIRHLNQFNILDSSTGASGDGMSLNNKNLSVLNSSTPIQMNNLNTTSSNLSGINSTKSSLKKQHEVFDSSRSNETVINNNGSSNTITAIQNLKEYSKSNSNRLKLSPSHNYSENDHRNLMAHLLNYDQIFRYGDQVRVVNDNRDRIEIVDSEIENEEEEEAYENYDNNQFEELIEIGPYKDREIHHSLNDHIHNRTVSNNKSNYSSQEDFLSSIHPGETSSMECSENVYVSDFDKLAIETNPKANQYFNNNKINEYLMNKSNMNKNQYNLVSDLNIPAPPAQYNDYEQFNNKKQTNIAGSINLATNQINSFIQPSTSKFKNQNVTNDQENPFRNSEYNRKNLHSSESSTSNAAAYSVPSLSESTSSDSIPNGIGDSSENNKTSKLANVRMDKHVIDTTKYKGYQYKLETRSNVSNQYHIKGLLTNEQTGHSLLINKTKVQTPNILTRVIIDN